MPTAPAAEPTPAAAETAARMEGRTEHGSPVPTAAVSARESRLRAHAREGCRQRGPSEMPGVHAALRNGIAPWADN